MRRLTWTQRCAGGRKTQVRNAHVHIGWIETRVQRTPAGQKLNARKPSNLNLYSTLLPAALSTVTDTKKPGGCSAPLVPTCEDRAWQLEVYGRLCEDYLLAADLDIAEAVATEMV
jgi:hypothetical protein